MKVINKLEVNESSDKQSDKKFFSHIKQNPIFLIIPEVYAISNKIFALEKRSFKHREPVSLLDFFKTAPHTRR